MSRVHGWTKPTAPPVRAEEQPLRGMPTSACIGETARELKERYGDLLRAQPSFHEPEVDRAIDALGAAQVRMLGRREVPGSQQMTLDLGGAR